MRKILIANIVILTAMAGCISKNEQVTETPINEPIETVDSGTEVITQPEKEDAIVVASTDPIILPEVEYISFTDYPTQDLREYMTDVKRYQYPDNDAFRINFLDGTNLCGYLTRTDNNQRIQEVYSMDLENGEYTAYCSLPIDNVYQNMPFRLIGDNWILYEFTDQMNQIASYVVYDLQTGESEEVVHIEPCPNLHYSYRAVTEDGFLLAYLLMEDYEHYQYVLMHYNVRTGEKEIIENENCGYCVCAGNMWYYLCFDNDTKVTKLICYDPILKEKHVLMQLQSESYYLKSLCTNGTDTLVFSIYDRNIEHVYQVNISDNSCTYLFDAAWYESMNIGGHMLTWKGDNILEDRIQPMYHLFDLNNHVFYLNVNGNLFVSEEGMYLNWYKVPENQLGKAGAFENENSEITFFRWPES